MENPNRDNSQERHGIHQIILKVASDPIKSALLAGSTLNLAVGITAFAYLGNGWMGLAGIVIGTSAGKVLLNHL